MPLKRLNILLPGNQNIEWTAAPHITKDAVSVVPSQIKKLSWTKGSTTIVEMDLMVVNPPVPGLTIINICF